MKRIIAIILFCSLIFTSCTPNNPINSNEIVSKAETTNEEIIEQMEESPEIQVEHKEYARPETIPNESNIISKGLNDVIFQNYIKDKIYYEAIRQLDSEDYLVENVEVLYYPKSYIEAMSSNSQRNLYFGYTSEELDDFFEGTRYVFTLGEDGETIVVPMQVLTDDIFVKAMEDVLIGSGVLLICVTVSLVAAPAAPAVSVIFTASASTGTVFAIDSSVFSFVTAAVIKGYETESVEEALKAGVVSAADGFKWGAITGVVIGGASETWALKKMTANGLSMNEAAIIQKESGFPIELIQQFKSLEEYEVYKEAGLYTQMVNGKLALVRDIDLDYVSELPDGTKVTNLVRMEMGYAPVDPATGKVYQLHHINQNPEGTLAILTESEHQGNAQILNQFGKESQIDRNEFNKIRQEFWKSYAKLFLQ